MIVSGECHYARNRSWFKTYRPIQGTAQGAPVKGIGTVELEVVRAPDDPRTHTLLLEDVLHIPSALCNGFAASLMPIKQSWSREGTQGYDQNDEEIFHGTVFCGLRRLVLRGDPQGESPLEEERHRKGTHFWLSLYPTFEEMANLFGGHVVAA